MQGIQLWIARIAGVAGLLLVLVAVGTRLTGQFWIGSLQTGTLLQAGTAAMVIGCLGYLALLAEHSRERR
jgi:hypothetical protein